jgi:hypothetical protein
MLLEMANWLLIFRNSYRRGLLTLVSDGKTTILGQGKKNVRPPCFKPSPSFIAVNV